MPSNCDRCKKETRITTMSMFNTQDICMECLDKEKKHPKYRNAANAERLSCLLGNYNFPGVGLPSDLKS